MRLRRKHTVRRPLRRSNPPTAVGGPSASAPASDSRPAQWRMRCMCGTILDIGLDDDGKRRTCDTCRRRFDIHFTEDLSTRQKGVSLHYLSSDNRASGETSSVGAGTTSFRMPSGDLESSANPHGLLMEPELPDAAHFKCSCGVLLAIPKSQFEKRSRCPACNARMLIFMLYDSRVRSFTLQLFSLIDARSGDTLVLSKL
jgi:hypothetical protein